MSLTTDQKNLLKAAKELTDTQITDAIALASSKKVLPNGGNPSPATVLQFLEVLSRNYASLVVASKP